MRQKFFGAMIVAIRGHGQLGFVSHHMFQARLGDGAQRAVVQKWVPLAPCQPLFSVP